jgi:hypothetical protein
VAFPYIYGQLPETNNIHGMENGNQSAAVGSRKPKKEDYTHLLPEQYQLDMEI